MAGLETFDDFLSTEQFGESLQQKPFQFRDGKNDEDLTLKWLVENFDYAYRMGESRFRSYRRFHALNKGIHWKNQDARDANRENDDTNRKPRHTVNFIHEMIDARATQMARLRTNFVAIPMHDEILDINSSKAGEMLLKNRGEEIDIEGLNQEMDRIKYNYGDAFAFVLWNKDAGHIHPRFKRIIDKYGRDKIPGPIRKKMKFDPSMPFKVGDADVLIVGPDCVVPEMHRKKWRDVNHVDLIEWVHIEELKAEHKHTASKLKPNTKDFYDYELSEITRPIDYVMVRHFYHKKTKWLPEGAYIKYCDDAILEWNNYPYEEDELPFVHDGDVEIYSELWCRPFIANIEQMQRMYNILQSCAARDLSVGSMPKWVMPKGAATTTSLNNDFAIIEYGGAIAPALVQHNPVSRQVWEMQDRVELKITKQSKVYAISRGEVPQGITANSAIRFLDEQESQIIFVDEVKRKRRVLGIYRKMLCRFQQYYRPEDERVIKSLGPNNEYMIESFFEADLKGIADLALQNTSSLSDSKTGKISDIIDLNAATQKDPIFRREDVVHMLDLGLDEAFVDGATVAVTSAKTIIDRILRGKDVPEPSKSDNHLVMYHVFDRFMQSNMYRDKVPPEMKSVFEQRVMTMEGLMYAHAINNSKYLAQLMELDRFPIFYTMDTPLFLLQQEQMKMMAGPTVDGADPVGADTTKVKNMPGQAKEVTNQ